MATTETTRDETSDANASANLLKGLMTGAWGPLKEALAHVPGWRETVVPQEGTTVRFVLWPFLIGTPDLTLQSLRLMREAPPDDRLVAPGLSERALCRLNAARLLPDLKNGTKAQARLAQRIETAAKTWGGDGFLSDDAAAWWASGALSTGVLGAEFARTAAAEFWLLPHEVERDAAQRWPLRSLEDVVTLAGLARRMEFEEGAASRVGFSTFHALYVASVDQHQKVDLSRGLPDALERLGAAHPEQRGALALAAVDLLITGVQTVFARMPTEQVDWNATTERVVAWLDEGVGADGLAERLQRLKAVATGLPAVQAMAARGLSVLNQRTLLDGTPEANAQRRKKHRL